MKLPLKVITATYQYDEFAVEEYLIVDAEETEMARSVEEKFVTKLLQLFNSIAEVKA